MNEEKEPKTFVWERSSRGVCNAAIYRGVPVDGSGKPAEMDRFAFKKKLEEGEQHLSLDQLIEKYPCPAGEISTHEPKQVANLKRNELP